MSDVTPFEFPATGQAVRTVTIDGEPWFVLADVAKILGYRDAEHAGRLLRDHQLNTLPEGIATELGQRGGRPPRIVTEGGLYRLVMRSNVALAESFQDWVTDDVLPAIRRTGDYPAAPTFEIPQTYADALELAARQARELDASRHDPGAGALGRGVGLPRRGQWRLQRPRSRADPRPGPDDLHRAEPAVRRPPPAPLDRRKGQAVPVAGGPGSPREPPHMNRDRKSVV